MHPRVAPQEVNDNINEVFDIKFMVIDALVRDKELLNQIFMKCGRRELNFIKVQTQLGA